MEPLEQRILELEKKVDAMSKIVNRLYKVFLATVIISIIAFVLPLIGLLFAIPAFLSNYQSALQF